MEKKSRRDFFDLSDARIRSSFEAAEISPAVIFPREDSPHPAHDQSTTHIIFKKPQFNRGIMADNTKKPSSQGKTGWSTGAKVLVGIIAVVMIIAVIAIVTLTIQVLDSQSGTEYPYTTNYRVTLPDGEPITIGSSHILVTSYNDELIAEVDGTKEKLVVGQQRVINPRHAQVTIMGLPLIDTDFQITLTYLGSTGTNANFDMTVKTTRQVPEFIISKLIPAKMNAQPA